MMEEGKMREQSLKDLPVLGRGLHSVVYDYDEDKILKVFTGRQENPRLQLEKEQACTAQMKCLGARVAAAGEVVLLKEKGREYYGLFYEKVKGISLGKALLTHPERTETYARETGRFLRNLHSIQTKPGLFPDVKKTYTEYVGFYRTFGVLTLQEAERLQVLMNRMPCRNALLHGDLSFENLMRDEEGLILIDPGQAAVGHPIWDLLIFYRNLFVGPEIGMIEGGALLPSEQTGRFLDTFLRTYLGIKEDAADERLLTKTKKVLESFSLLWRIGNGFLAKLGRPVRDTGASDEYKKRLFSSLPSLEKYFTKECGYVFAKYGREERQTDRLDIVYASDHSYMFCCCVSVFSLMTHLPPNRQVRLHLLIDESFCEEDERLLQLLSDRFSNLEFVKHSVKEEAFEQRDFKESIWSKATCYRLILPELLADVDLCLYLDSDTLIVGDLMPLWETDMSAYCLAGVFDDISPVRMQTVGDRVPGIETYINAGVLLMNLALMREKGIQEKLLAGVSDFLVVDQDLLNAVCYGMIRLLPPDYNCIPGVHTDSPRILHFLMRDYLRPWKNRLAKGSREWWDCAKEFASVYDLETLRAGADWYQRGSISWIFRQCADYTRVYVVGSGTDAERIYRALHLGKCKGLQGILGEEDSIAYAPDILLIAASRKAKLPILESFLSQDGAERQVIRFSRWPVSYYNLVPEHCRRDVYGDLLMWEFGVDARNASTCAALLELNAARYPEKEALVEWKDGVRRACSYRELNRMANRMADWIRKQNSGSCMQPESAGVVLPDSPLWNLEMFAALLGILKSGRVLGLRPYQADTDPVGQVSKEPVFTVDLSALYEERNSCRAPFAEVLPEEPAVEEETSSDVEGGIRILTHRELCVRAEELRRRCGWHAGDRLLLVSPSSQRGFTELLAAFAGGNTTVLLLSAADLGEVAEREKCTIVSINASVWKAAAGEQESCLQKKSRALPASCRLLLTGEITGSEGEGAGSLKQQSSLKSHRSIPYVSVDGQGYEGSFRYDCEWY